LDSKKSMSEEFMSEELMPLVAIAGIDQATIRQYMDYLNANDFAAASRLFSESGVLQPPFQKPITGQGAILQFLEQECTDLKLMPERGKAEAIDGKTHIRVTGKVQAPLFGNGLHVAWRFVLNADEQIDFVAIDLLASPKELLNFAGGAKS
jgi:hypothetical protein